MAIEHSENRQQQDERLRRERSEADATLARLKADYANSPEQRLRANREELARLQSDPFLADRRRGDITRLERQVMIGERNLEAAAGRMSQYEKLDLALGGATDPEASVRIGADLSVDDMRIQIEHDRNNGLSDHVIRRAFNGSSASAAAVQHARLRFERLSNDPEWGRKIMAKDPAAMEEFRLLSEDARGGPNEKSWSTPIPGTNTA